MSPPQYPIALTMGDPCGIGPEIVASLFRPDAGISSQGLLVIGDVNIMRRALGWIGHSMPVALIEHPADLAAVPSGCLPVLQPPHGFATLTDCPIGTVHPHAGAAAAACVRHAAMLALQGDIAGMVTAPIHKQALAEAGEVYPGHTELLQACAAARGQVPAVRMMLANDSLRVVLVTVHLALRRAIDAITFDTVLETIGMAHRAAQSWGLPHPRIAVAGLNPHAGEAGAFGDEEIRMILPAVNAARAQGIDARGPFAPDTVFMRARHAEDHPGEFDVVIAMTHDHGLIPIKYLGLDHGVNVTLGLPFIRTSPDHGTAFDLAGTGKANPASLRAALAWAQAACQKRGAS
ncbi:MAG: 4-hydroxythreonine-4-phosphate dehydrogenase PdxA [Burkholderiales bacterium]